MYIDIFAGSVLRDAKLSDIPALLRLEDSIDDVVGLSKWNAARWVYEISSNIRGRYVWVIQQGGQEQELIYVVGFVKIDDYVDVIKLTAAGVGRPFTAKLIMTGLSWLESQKVKKIKGRCSDAMRDFYKRLGFIIVGEIPNYFGVGIKAYSIEKIV